MNGTGRVGFDKGSFPNTAVHEGSLDADANNWHQNDSDLSQDESYYVPSSPFAQKLTALDPSLYQGSGDDFCTEENFDQMSAYMNHQLNIHGFSSNLQFLKADKQSASRTVTTLYKVLQQHLKDTEYKEEMELNWRRLSRDLDTTTQNLNMTKTQLEKTERDTDMLAGRIAALEEELRVETEKHRNTREELKSAKANLQYTKTQYAHEVRKKEQEMNVLKEKVQKSIARNMTSTATASPSIPGGITIINPLPRTLYGKQHANDAEQLLKEVIDQQRAKEVEIVEENEQLRRTLYTVKVELEGLLGKHTNGQSNSPNSYGLPFEMVKDKIETEIRDTLMMLEVQWDHRPSLEPTISPLEVTERDQKIENLQRELGKVQLELEDSTLLVQGAQKMIDNLSSGNFLAGLPEFKLNVGGSEMTLQEIDDTETKLKQQREDLAKERKQFTAACLDLGKQREELHRLKMEFEESKRTFHLDKVVSFLSSPILRSQEEDRQHDEGEEEEQEPEQEPVQEHTPLQPQPSLPQHTVQPSRKRMATSTLPTFLNMPNGRSVRPRTATNMIEVPREQRPSGYESKINTTHVDPAHDVHGDADEEEEETLLRAPTRPGRNLFSTQR